MSPVLPDGAIASDWVESEAMRALDEERERKRPLPFLIRIDEAVLDTKGPGRGGSATSARSPAGKDHNAYQQGFARLMRDLRVGKGG